MDFQEIERKWQNKWLDAKVGQAQRNTKKKFFMIFAYPGISGYLHVGHMRGYSYTDAVCRYKRLRGYNVLFPVGTHASGNQAIAFANKVRQGDEQWISYLKRNGCPDNTIEKLTEYPNVINHFNAVYVEEYWKRFGFLCDWRRFTSTSYPDYERFIQWQFKKLHEVGLLTQKPYFATFCPEHGPVAVDPSETDISKGGHAEKNEYTLLKFPVDDVFLVAATLRPETVYGQTNVWIHPDATYVKVSVGDEVWVMSAQAAEKLTYQKDDVKILDTVNSSTYIGKTTRAPGVNRNIPIFPATFCDPDIGSGIVTSVPSHAPVDWIGLLELKKDTRTCKTYGIDPSSVSPLALITLPGFSEHPARDMCTREGITSQNDADKLERAKKEIYKTEFHTGIMKDNCGPYAGMRVEEAKERVKQDLIASKNADVFHDLSEEVVCRCGKRIIIKRIDDQWFIRYSDDALTKTAKAHAATMNVFPHEYYENLPGALDWYGDRACTRLGKWIGSRLPQDEKWIVEPISDSTLYPLYYIISPYVNEGTIKTDQLTESFFDYVVLGRGDCTLVAQETGVSCSILDDIRQDVAYWYPLDINLGGKEHQTVHFPVFVMNHVGLLDEEFWPQGIFVNYWVTGKGSKISKSKGGAEPIPGAIEKYSVDGMRLYYAHIGSAHSDVVWSEEVVLHYKNAVLRIWHMFEDVLKTPHAENTHIDAWLHSQLHHHVRVATEAYESLDLRQAATEVFFSMYDTLKWYRRRGGGHSSILRDVMKSLCVLMSPITPHIAEEMWEQLQGNGFVSAATWPLHDESLLDKRIEANEHMIIQLLDDVRAVMKLAGIKNPQHITVFVAPNWKYTLFAMIKKQLAHTRNVGEILKHVMRDETFKQHRKEVNKLVMMCVKDPSKIPELVTDTHSEMESLRSAKTFLSEETGADVIIEKSDTSEVAKARQALPGKPALIVK